jgi:cytochrome c oxidase assembly factor CtaG
VRGTRAQAQKRGAFKHSLHLEHGAFALSLGTLVLSLLSPLDAWSDLTFSAHMTQHELLMLLAAPFLALARPLPVYLHALPVGLRAHVSTALRKPWAVRAFRWATAPLVALLVHGAIRWLWHLPSWFEAALASEWIHGVQHASFFLSALLFWWGLLQGGYGRAGYGVAALFVLLTAMHTGALGALIAFSEHAWYPSYGLRVGETGLDPLHDQQLAGLIMWVGAFVWMLLLALALLLAWLGEARRRTLRTRLTPSHRAEQTS